MKINIVNESSHPLPSYETIGSAGMDLRANLNQSIMIKSGERKLVTTGLYLELSQGFEAQIRPRSGLAYSHGITVLNSPGTIDSDYRGEIGIILINHSDQDFKVNDGDRIAQLVIAKYERISWNEVVSLDQTQRGDNGYGSTGI